MSDQNSKIQNSKITIICMAVIASGTATLLHEGLGHGVTAWLRGDHVTALTSNHLSTLTPDRWVDAGGTLVNLTVGALALIAMHSSKASVNTRYFLWLLAALNLLPGAGYFMLSGLADFGDWAEVIRGLPHQFAIRAAMTLVGAALYLLAVRLLAISIRPWIQLTQENKSYNLVGRLPYYAAGLFECAAGLFDPLGIRLLLLSTIPAAFGGSSGLMWADSLMPSKAPEKPLTIQRQPVWLVLAVVLGSGYIFFLGRGISFNR